MSFIVPDEQFLNDMRIIQAAVEETYIKDEEKRPAINISEQFISALHNIIIHNHLDTIKHRKEHVLLDPRRTSDYKLIDLVVVSSSWSFANIISHVFNFTWTHRKNLNTRFCVSTCCDRMTQVQYKIEVFEPLLS